jgi:acyl-coenzyme A synthetase/AMP-(fatty) acid ligase
LSFVPLARLLADGRPPRATTAYAGGAARDFADLQERVADLAGRIASEGRGRWLVHCEDAYAFAVALLAVAHAGAQAVLLPNRQGGSLARAAHLAQGALLDAAEDDARRALAGVPCVLDPLDRAAGGRPAALAPLDPTAPLLELSTSGTTGEGKQVQKALRHLDAEIAVLETSFGAALGPDTQVFATASPQHLYGLLFRVLWPLAAGRPFHGTTYLHAEELLPRIEQAGDALLATTPAHLSRMSGLARLRGPCREVFCSGGPLERETALRVHEALGRGPVEVLGSTESGGIAWRRQEPGPAPGEWTAFPGVRVERVAEGPDAGRLRVTSPFASGGASAGLGDASSVTLGDLVEIPSGGRFRLGGRADRVVKVGDKRLSLPEMESRLCTHPFVQEAALLALEQGGETRVAAAVVLAEPGRRALAAEGRRAVSARLLEELAAGWDRVLLPRAWRYVEALPRDERGKLPVARLRELFAATRVPRVREEIRGPRSLVRELSVPDDLVFLEGHFEGFPVVPGVVQVGWVVEAAQAVLGHAPRIEAVENLKFKEVLLPGQRVRLELGWNEAGDVLRFRLAAGERVFSTGRLRLRAKDPR